jgi:hypothetical protein
MPGHSVASWQSSAYPLTPTDRSIAQLLDQIWRERFADVPRINDVVAGYDFPWKWRLGRIRMTLDQRLSEITLNGLLASQDVPEVVRVAILAHEIVHYAQGFGSPLPRQQRHAHAHGAVSHELAQRGLAQHEHMLDEWSLDEWPHFRAQARRQQSIRQVAWSSCATAAKVVY